MGIDINKEYFNLNKDLNLSKEEIKYLNKLSEFKDKDKEFLKRQLIGEPISILKKISDLQNQQTLIGNMNDKDEETIGLIQFYYKHIVGVDGFEITGKFDEKFNAIWQKIDYKGEYLLISDANLGMFGNIKLEAQISDDKTNIIDKKYFTEKDKFKFEQDTVNLSQEDKEKKHLQIVLTNIISQEFKLDANHPICKEILQLSTVSDKNISDLLGELDKCNDPFEKLVVMQEFLPNSEKNIKQILKFQKNIFFDEKFIKENNISDANYEQFIDLLTYKEYNSCNKQIMKYFLKLFQVTGSTNDSDKIINAITSRIQVGRSDLEFDMLKKIFDYRKFSSKDLDKYHNIYYDNVYNNKSQDIQISINDFKQDTAINNLLQGIQFKDDKEKGITRENISLALGVAYEKINNSKSSTIYDLPSYFIKELSSKIDNPEILKRFQFINEDNEKKSNKLQEFCELFKIQNNIKQAKELTLSASQIISKIQQDPQLTSYNSEQLVFAVRYFLTNGYNSTSLNKVQQAYNTYCIQEFEQEKLKLQQNIKNNELQLKNYQLNTSSTKKDEIEKNITTWKGRIQDYDKGILSAQNNKLLIPVDIFNIIKANQQDINKVSSTNEELIFCKEIDSALTNIQQHPTSSEAMKFIQVTNTACETGIVKIEAQNKANVDKQHIPDKSALHGDIHADSANSLYFADHISYKLKDGQVRNPFYNTQDKENSSSNKFLAKEDCNSTENINKEILRQVFVTNNISITKDVRKSLGVDHFKNIFGINIANEIGKTEMHKIFFVMRTICLSFVHHLPQMAKQQNNNNLKALLEMPSSQQEINKSQKSLIEKPGNPQENKHELKMFFNTINKSDNGEIKKEFSHFIEEYFGSGLNKENKFIKNITSAQQNFGNNTTDISVWYISNYEKSNTY